MVIAGLGPMTLTGLDEDISIPKQTDAATAEWEDPESTAVTPSDSTYGAIVLSPKTVKAATEYSRRTLLQANPSIEALVMNDLTQEIALAIDLAAIAGLGTGGQPTGILNTAGIGSVTGTTLGWPGILEFESVVSTANALLGNLYWVTHPNIRALLKGREKAATTAQFIWEGNNTMNGYRTAVTTQIDAATLLFGNFASLIMAFWGVLDLLVDPYSLSLKGAVRIVGAQSVDVNVRHAESFAAASTIT